MINNGFIFGIVFVTSQIFLSILAGTVLVNNILAIHLENVLINDAMFFDNQVNTPKEFFESNLLGIVYLDL